MGIIDVVDEILSKDSRAAGLAIKWHIFGSNGHEKADYSRGVLERFTKCEKDGHSQIKTIANPRKIDYKPDSHFQIYFTGLHSIDETGLVVQGQWIKDNVSAKKITVNHYYTKSREEYEKTKVQRGWACSNDNPYDDKRFRIYDRNDVFDDGILKYRDARAKIYQPPDNSHVEERLFRALSENLLPAFLPNTSPEFYTDKMETFLTCRAVASYLKTKLADDKLAKSFEEASCKAILKSLDKMTLPDAQLLIRELPELLKLSYPVVKELLAEIIQRIPKLRDGFRLSAAWAWFNKLYYLQDLLEDVLNLKQDKTISFEKPAHLDVENYTSSPRALEQDLPTVPKDCVKIPDKISPDVTARIDVKMMSVTSKFKILSVSDEKATVWKPDWFQKEGIGYQIESRAGNLEFTAQTDSDGQIRLWLRGIAVRGSANKFIPHWVDYTKFIVNEKTIFDIPTPAWHDKPYNYIMDAKAGEEIKIQVEFLPHVEKT